MGSLDTLTMLVDTYVKRYKFLKDKIEVYMEEDITYGITIDGAPWSNHLTFDEAVSTLSNFLQGVAIAEKYLSKSDVLQFSVDVEDGYDEDNIKTAIENAGIKVRGISFVERWKAEEYLYE